MKKLIENYENLVFDIHFNDENTLKSILIFFHGYKSFRNWGFIPYICDKVSESNAIVINLDFSLNGILSEHPLKIDVDNFAKNRVSQEIQDGQMLINLLQDSNAQSSEMQEILKNWNGKIILSGHSRGAGIALILANQNKLVEKLALIAPIANFNRYRDRFIKEWIDAGKIEFYDSQSQQTLRMDATYVQDIVENTANYDLKSAAFLLEKDLLILQGENDYTIKQEESFQICKSFKENNKNSQFACNFVLIEKANHLLNCSHPFESSNKYVEQAISEIIQFLGK
jgi:esterase/lipase